MPELIRERGAAEPENDLPPPKFPKFLESRRCADPPRDPDLPKLPREDPDIPPRAKFIERPDDPPPPRCELKRLCEPPPRDPPPLRECPPPPPWKLPPCEPPPRECPPPPPREPWLPCDAAGAGAADITAKAKVQMTTRRIDLNMIQPPEQTRYAQAHGTVTASSTFACRMCVAPTC